MWRDRFGAASVFSTSCSVMNQNATAEITPDTMTPLYSAFMILPPSETFTKKVPTMEEMMEAEPSASGYNTAFWPMPDIIRPPNNIVAVSYTHLRAHETP